MDAVAAPDFSGLAASLRSLASPVRLELLHRLLYPHQLGEIRLSPMRREPGGTTNRPAARQTVQMHLDRLVEEGFLHVERGEPGQRQAPRYVLSQQRVYGFVEDLRSLAKLHGSHLAAGDMTGTSPAPPAPQDLVGPRLVLVHGVHEGKPYRLDGPGVASWTIGRKAGVHVNLDYDPYVSIDHCAVHARNGRFLVRDLHSKNGTYVNWGRLPQGAEHPLRAGDVIGVGRSLLCFSDA